MQRRWSPGPNLVRPTWWLVVVVSVKLHPPCADRLAQQRGRAPTRWYGLDQGNAGQLRVGLCLCSIRCRPCSPRASLVQDPAKCPLPFVGYARVPRRRQAMPSTVTTGSKRCALACRGSSPPGSQLCNSPSRNQRGLALRALLQLMLIPGSVRETQATLALAMPAPSHPAGEHMLHPCALPTDIDGLALSSTLATDPEPRAANPESSRLLTHGSPCRSTLTSAQGESPPRLRTAPDHSPPTTLSLTLPLSLTPPLTLPLNPDANANPNANRLPP